MLKVLVADDCKYARLILTRAICSVSGFDIAAEAENGMQLVKTAKELSPDVVFIDVGMPVIDGLTAAKEISIT
jgi:two-component system chemotaxis response regulator CheY